MTIFEHLSVLLSLILSLGIASLLLGVARLCQEWRRVVFSWPHALWTLVIFLTQILFWLYAFSFHNFSKTSLIGLTMPIAMVTAVFLQGALVTPNIEPSGPIDLAAFHNTHRFQYLGALVVYYVLFEAWDGAHGLAAAAAMDVLCHPRILPGHGACGARLQAALGAGDGGAAAAAAPARGVPAARHRAQPLTRTTSRMWRASAWYPAREKCTSSKRCSSGTTASTST